MDSIPVYNLALVRYTITIQVLDTPLLHQFKKYSLGVLTSALGLTISEQWPTLTSYMFEILVIDIMTLVLKGYFVVYNRTVYFKPFKHTLTSSLLKFIAAPNIFRKLLSGNNFNTKS